MDDYREFLESLQVPFFVDPGYLPGPNFLESKIVLSQTNIEVQINRLTIDQVNSLINKTADMIKAGHIIKLNMVLKHEEAND